MRFTNSEQLDRCFNFGKEFSKQTTHLSSDYHCLLDRHAMLIDIF